MKHYFRVVKANNNSNPIKRKKKNFIFSWLSGLNVSGWLILINVILFIMFSVMGVLSNADCSKSLCNYIALQPNNFFNNYYFWTLLTSMFMHAGFLHLFINMLSLFFIGRFLEMLIGKIRFFWLYLFGGLFAGLFFCGLAFLFGTSDLGIKLFGSLNTFAVGASGAIFAIAGVLCFLTPKNKVYLIAGPIIAIILQVALGNLIPESINNILNIIISVYIFISIISMFSINSEFRRVSLPIKMPFWLLPIVAIIPLFIIGFFVSLPIGNTAHLGGFIAGAFYGIYLRLKYKNKTRAISGYFSS